MRPHALTWGLLAALLALALAHGPALGQTFPAGYGKYGKECAKAQAAAYGPLWRSVLLAQVEAESGWRPRVCSAYACGLTQFTDPTRRAVERKYGLSGSLWKPEYACTLQGLLMRDLAREVAPSFVGFQSQWAAVLRSYNGSPAAFWCEHRKAGRPVDAFQMEPFRCRAPAFHRENITYPRRILFTLYPKYLEAWGR
jgi:hypothetical protein